MRQSMWEIKPGGRITVASLSLLWSYLQSALSFQSVIYNSVCSFYCVRILHLAHKINVLCMRTVSFGCFFQQFCFYSKLWLSGLNGWYRVSLFCRTVVQGLGDLIGVYCKEKDLKQLKKEALCIPCPSWLDCWLGQQHSMWSDSSSASHCLLWDHCSLNIAEHKCSFVCALLLTSTLGIYIMEEKNFDLFLHFIVF